MFNRFDFSGAGGGVLFVIGVQFTNMKSLIKILVSEIVLCIVYLAVASIVNGHYPFLECGYAPGMTCAYGVAALYFALL